MKTIPRNNKKPPKKITMTVKRDGKKAEVSTPKNKQEAAKAVGKWITGWKDVIRLIPLRG